MALNHAAQQFEQANRLNIQAPRLKSSRIQTEQTFNLHLQTGNVMFKNFNDFTLVDRKRSGHFIPQQGNAFF